MTTVCTPVAGDGQRCTPRSAARQPPPRATPTPPPDVHAVDPWRSVAICGSPVGLRNEPNPSDRLAPQPHATRIWKSVCSSRPAVLACLSVGVRRGPRLPTSVPGRWGRSSVGSVQIGGDLWFASRTAKRTQFVRNRSGTTPYDTPARASRRLIRRASVSALGRPVIAGWRTRVSSAACSLLYLPSAIRRGPCLPAGCVAALPTSVPGRCGRSSAGSVEISGDLWFTGRLRNEPNVPETVAPQSLTRRTWKSVRSARPAVVPCPSVGVRRGPRPADFLVVIGVSRGNLRPRMVAVGAHLCFSSCWWPVRQIGADQWRSVVRQSDCETNPIRQTPLRHNPIRRASGRAPTLCPSGSPCPCPRARRCRCAHACAVCRPAVSHPCPRCPCGRSVEISGNLWSDGLRLVTTCSLTNR
jgi:hypothetical protein